MTPIRLIMKTNKWLGLALVSVSIAGTPGWSAPIPSLSLATQSDYVTVDGKLEEWKQPPQIILGPQNQVAGTQKLTSAQDFSARVWLRLHERGLYVAGQVQDDHVRLPAKPAQWLHADHLELWLSFPAARMPAMGFANQFGFQEVPHEKTCEQGDLNADIRQCRAWFQTQTKRRQWLPQLFTHQYVIQPGPLQEVWWQRQRGPEKLDLPNKDSYENTPTVFKVIPGGYQFEAFIPISEWPATQQWPLQQAQLLVDVVDNDTGSPHQEHFLSSSPQRKYGQPSTFHPVKIQMAPVETSEPSVTTELLKDQPLAFVFPSHPNHILGFMNLGMGYQYTPTEPSPAVVNHPVPTKPLLYAGDYQVYLMPDKLGVFGFEQKLMSFKGTQKVSELKLTGRAVWGEPDHVLNHYSPAHALLALYSIATLSSFGSGMCGACPYGEVEVVTLDRSGQLKFLVLLHTDDHASHMEWPTPWVEPDGSAFGFRYNYDNEEKDQAEVVKRVLKWKELVEKATKK